LAFTAGAIDLDNRRKHVHEAHRVRMEFGRERRPCNDQQDSGCRVNDLWHVGRQIADGHGVPCVAQFFEAPIKPAIKILVTVRQRIEDCGKGVCALRDERIRHRGSLATAIPRRLRRKLWAPGTKCPGSIEKVGPKTWSLQR
jgi:hypothetical protein